MNPEIDDLIDTVVKEARDTKDAGIIKARDELTVALAKHNKSPISMHYEKELKKLTRRIHELECENYKLKSQVTSGWVEGNNK